MNSTNSKSKNLLSQDIIMSRIRKKHGDKYTYDRFVFNGVDNKSIVTCRIHGDFSITPYHHYERGHGCPKCNTRRKLTRSEVVEQFNNVHHNRYGYNNFVYKNDSEKGLVTCFEHGDFLVKPNNHKNGSGCPKCGVNKLGYGRTKFVERANSHKNKKCILYVIECSSESELFYKIGVTTTTIKRRFDGFHMPYDFKILNSISGFNPEFIWDIEHKIHSLLKAVRITPEKYFRGRTECFSEITPDVKKLIKKLQSTEQLQLIA